MRTHLGNDRCTRCGGGSGPCPVCNPVGEGTPKRKLNPETMTDEQVRIALATARGMFRIEPLRRTTARGNVGPNGTRLWYCEEHHGGAATYAKIPDWPNDLNAVHHLEKWLYNNLMDSDQWARYGKRLEDTHPQSTILTRDKVDYHEFAHLCHISARRRCNCLLDALLGL